MKETTSKWLKRIGSKKAMQERQRLRWAGTINAKIPGNAMQDIKVHMLAGNRHSLFCKCPDCRPVTPRPPEP